MTYYGIHLPGDIDYYFEIYFHSIPFSNCWATVRAILQTGLSRESAIMKDVTDKAEFVGDFRNRSLDFGWGIFDEETKPSKLGIELNNDRAALMEILELMVHK